MKSGVSVYVDCATPNRQTMAEVEKALRLLKKRMEDAGVFKEMRRRRFHVSDSEIRSEKKLARRKSILKMQKKERKLLESGDR